MNEKQNRWDPAARPEATESTSTSAPPALGTFGDRTYEVVENEATDEAELHAILGAGTHFQGTLSFAGRVRIDGEFTGRILGGEVVVVGEGAKISGELRARRVIVLGGRVEAAIVATESIELFIPAVVQGDLRCPHIYMDRGIEFHGTCDMTGQEER